MKSALPAARFFLSEQNIIRLEPFGTGNVNDTFLVTLPRNRQMVLQRLNPDVFPDPLLVQRNIRLVITHLASQVRGNQELKNRFTPLIVYQGKNGDSYQDEEGGVWRLVNRVPGNTCETINNPSQAEELGRCLGIFHRLLSTLAPTELGDTLPGFHHTPACLEQYDRVRMNPAPNHDPDIEFCHRFITGRRALAAALVDAPALSRTIIHGDPKVANFIFADNSNRVVALIDLDTVRHGLLLHDIGDALRSCCNPMGESPPAAEQIRFESALFAAWIKGYCEEAGLLLTIADKAHIVLAVRVIAFELGLRFVTDHLSGDRYFKTRLPRHNLIRALVQFRLVQSIEEQFENLESILSRIYQ